MNVFKEALRLERETNEFGFRWPHYSYILAQIKSECAEIEESLEHQESRERLQEEIGDLMHAVFSLCATQGFDPEETLAKNLEKFEQRFKALKQTTQEAGYQSLIGLPVEAQLEFWKRAKLLCNKS